MEACGRAGRTASKWGVALGGAGSSWAFSAFAVPFIIALNFAHLQSSLPELGEREQRISKSSSCLLFLVNLIKLT